MNLYTHFAKPILFQWPAERAHRLIFSGMRIVQRIPGGLSLLRFIAGKQPKMESIPLFGLTFPSPVGLAAGFDKNAECIDAFAAMGFGFVEIGTLTPKAQPGNPEPRLFRLPKDQALINRMGFNNKGLENAIKNLKKRRCKIIVGGNIGKNKETPLEQAALDYVACVRALHPVVDYFTVNVSSPNTPGLRALQEKEPLRALLHAVLTERDAHSPRRPVLLKMAPDLSPAALQEMAELSLEVGLDGLVATNTTVDRSGLQSHPADIDAMGEGGVSGLPLRSKSTEAVSILYKATGGKLPIIAVGGIFSAADVKEKLKAGASLIQVYTGLVYEGPALVKNLKKAWTIAQK